MSMFWTWVLLEKSIVFKPIKSVRMRRVRAMCWLAPKIWGFKFDGSKTCTVAAGDPSSPAGWWWYRHLSKEPVRWKGAGLEKSGLVWIRSEWVVLGIWWIIALVFWLLDIAPQSTDMHSCFRKRHTYAQISYQILILEHWTQTLWFLTSLHPSGFQDSYVAYIYVPGIHGRGSIYIIYNYI